jgi:hypothetical protein
VRHRNQRVGGVEAHANEVDGFYGREVGHLYCGTVNEV